MAEIVIENREQAADWIETTVAARGRPLGFSALAACGLDDCGLTEPTLVNGFRVIRARRAWLGDFYPFEITDVAVRPRDWVKESVYTSMLLMSPGSPFRQLVAVQPSPDHAALFEKISLAAAKQLLGPNSQAVRFGWPSEDGRPQRFSAAIDWLADRMGVRPGAGYRPPRRKDGGVDVIAWRPFPDQRPGFPVALIQCTLQKEVVPKSRDIDLRIWSGWLTLDVDPTTVLAIPGTIGSKQDWDEIALRSLILDRIRISGLLGGGAQAGCEWDVGFANRALSQVGEHLAGAARV